MRRFIVASEAEAYSLMAEQPAEQFLYRGQTKRHLRTCPPFDYNGVKRDQYTLESLISTHYRGVEDFLRTVSAEIPPWFSHDATALRFILTLSTIEERGWQLTQGQAAVMWAQIKSTMKGQNGTQWDVMGSVGQHYQLPTGYIDATSDPRVALWFATHDWKTGDYVNAPQTRVIYRISLTGLVESEAFINRFYEKQSLSMGRTLEGREYCRHVDIRSTPTLLGVRPLRQQGWSLINFERLGFQRDLIYRDHIAVIEFPGDSGQIPENDLSAEYLRPFDEPLNQMFMRLRDVPLWTQHRQAWIDRRWRELTGGPAINLSDAQYGKWV